MKDHSKCRIHQDCLSLSDNSFKLWFRHGYLIHVSKAKRHFHITKPYSTRFVNKNILEGVIGFWLHQHVVYFSCP